MTEVTCASCNTVLDDHSDYEGVSGHTSEWWANKALYEHVDEVHS